MARRLTVLSVMFVCLAGCAGQNDRTQPSPTTMGLGDIRPRDPLLDTQCRVPCTVSPGPGCC